MNRLKAITDIRKKLISGGSSIGSWMQIPHPSIAEIIKKEKIQKFLLRADMILAWE